MSGSLNNDVGYSRFKGAPLTRTSSLLTQAARHRYSTSSYPTGEQVVARTGGATGRLLIHPRRRVRDSSSPNALPRTVLLDAAATYPRLRRTIREEASLKCCVSVLAECTRLKRSMYATEAGFDDVPRGYPNVVRGRRPATPQPPCPPLARTVALQLRSARGDGPDHRRPALHQLPHCSV